MKSARNVVHRKHCVCEERSGQSCLVGSSRSASQTRFRSYTMSPRGGARSLRGQVAALNPGLVVISIQQMYMNERPWFIFPFSLLRI